MNEKQKRVLEIGTDLLMWGLGFARLLKRVGEVNKMPDLSDLEKRKIVEAAERLGKLFESVLAANDAQPTADDALDHLIASYDRLKEETAKLNANIDRLLASRKA